MKAGGRQLLLEVGSVDGFDGVQVVDVRVGPQREQVEVGTSAGLKSWTVWKNTSAPRARSHGDAVPVGTNICLTLCEHAERAHRRKPFLGLQRSPLPACSREVQKTFGAPGSIEVPRVKQHG